MHVVRQVYGATNEREEGEERNYTTNDANGTFDITNTGEEMKLNNGLVWMYGFLTNIGIIKKM